ncbi:uncharacterized protein TRUGW13939_10227 [Talaromyces rugulosus]|uniref:Uncharacterized protein n=1 Tax=Talaromyces rugulosus TaxID=121627 RepID=A0A7H8R9G0_TALRU|nr:uncharacterized protein TRUGW13939_10227 [Talaromyces rugulosus]QKX63059.1 hypothetical protein TRUGW13939_10227 [Talaromyces rugulosus]
MPNILCCLAGSAARAPPSTWPGLFTRVRPAAAAAATSSVARRISSLGPSSNANLHAITWACAKPYHLTPDTIASSFPNIRPASTQNPITPVLFASPEFASWTDTSNSLLADWVNPLFKQIYPTGSPAVVYTVAAVVDKIATQRNDNAVQNASLGVEGLSLLLVNASDITVSAAQPAQIRGGSPTEPAFFFSTQTTTSDHRAISEQDVHTSRQVGLRLANTVFVNGKDRTLLGMRWTYDTTSNQYVLDNWKDLAVCDVDFVSENVRSSVNTPLHPVTSRRSVVSSMGNILRQLSNTPSTGPSGAIPASSELEKELPKYVNELGIPHQRVAVWALVEPLNSLLSETNHDRNNVERSIVNGSRIHRVVSGGGGWGKKQGLLSLDPEISFRDESMHPLSLDQVLSTQPSAVKSDEVPDISELSDLLGKGLEEKIASLSQITPVGDSIQFLVATESEAVEKIAGQQEDQNSHAISCSFGVGASVGAELVIPQSAPAQDTQTSADSSENVLVIPNHFGGVSETAISYSQGTTSGVSSEAGKCQTKLSVPGSRVDLWLS